MLTLITRVQHKHLYERMKASALKHSAGIPMEFISEPNPENLPIITPSYNRMGAKAAGDIMLFLHDDVEFVEDGWDARLVEAFAYTSFNVLGVIGVDRYNGGLLVNEGHPHTFGKFMNRAGSELRVNIYGPRADSKPMTAVDGMFMAVRCDQFKREKFDEKLDGLFFYDIDYCLRSNVGLIDILIAHYKTPELYGTYPAEMKPMESYEPYFYSKHGLTGPGPAGDTRAQCVSRDDYERHGHDKMFALFKEKYYAHV